MKDTGKEKYVDMICMAKRKGGDIVQEKKRVIFKIDRDMLDRFKSICHSKGVSMVAMVKILIADFVKREE